MASLCSGGFHSLEKMCCVKMNSTKQIHGPEFRKIQLRIEYFIRYTVDLTHFRKSFIAHLRYQYTIACELFNNYRQVVCFESLLFINTKILKLKSIRYRKYTNNDLHCIFY